MTNMKPSGAAVAAKAPGAVAKVPGPAKDGDELGETYTMHEESAKDIGNDLDDFEARLNGQKPSKPEGNKLQGGGARLCQKATCHPCLCLPSTSR